MTLPPTPQDPPPTDHFPAYAPGGSEVTDWVVMFAQSYGQRQETTFTDRMTERQALDLIEQAAQRKATRWLETNADTLIVQVSDRELFVYRPSMWTGERWTRVVAARLR